MEKRGTLAVIAHDSVTCTKKQNNDVASLLQFAEEIVHERKIRGAPKSVLIRF